MIMIVIRRLGFFRFLLPAISELVELGSKLRVASLLQVMLQPFARNHVEFSVGFHLPFARADLHVADESDHFLLNQ